MPATPDTQLCEPAVPPQHPASPQVKREVSVKEYDIFGNLTRTDTVWEYYLRFNPGGVLHDVDNLFPEQITGV